MLRIISSSQQPSLTKAAVKRHRVYRWGHLWGILAGNDWRVERRTPLSDQVEKVELLEIQAPPPLVDDIWEEDVYHLEDGSEWNGIHTFTGSYSAAQKWCSKAGIVIPPFEQEREKEKRCAVAVEHKRFTPKPSSRCLISDE